MVDDKGMVEHVGTRITDSGTAYEVAWVAALLKRVIKIDPGNRELVAAYDHLKMAIQQFSGLGDPDEQYLDASLEDLFPPETLPTTDDNPNDARRYDIATTYLAGIGKYEHFKQVLSEVEKMRGK